MQKSTHLFIAATCLLSSDSGAQSGLIQSCAGGKTKRGGRGNLRRAKAGPMYGAGKLQKKEALVMAPPLTFPGFWDLLGGYPVANELDAPVTGVTKLYRKAVPLLMRTKIVLNNANIMAKLDQLTPQDERAFLQHEDEHEEVIPRAARALEIDVPTSATIKDLTALCKEQLKVDVRFVTLHEKTERLDTSAIAREGADEYGYSLADTEYRYWSLPTYAGNFLGAVPEEAKLEDLQTWNDWGFPSTTLKNLIAVNALHFDDAWKAMTWGSRAAEEFAIYQQERHLEDVRAGRTVAYAKMERERKDYDLRQEKLFEEGKKEAKKWASSAEQRREIAEAVDAIREVPALSDGTPEFHSTGDRQATPRMVTILKTVKKAVKQLKRVVDSQNYYEQRFNKNDVGDLARFMFLHFTSANLLEWQSREGAHGRLRSFNLFPHNKMDRFWLANVLGHDVEAYGDMSGYKVSYAFLAGSRGHNAYEPRQYQPQSEDALCYSTLTDAEIDAFDFGRVEDDFEGNVQRFLNQWRQKERDIIRIIDEKVQEGETKYEVGWHWDTNPVPVSYWRDSCGCRTY